MKKLLALLVVALFSAAFAQTEINYWLWDSNQQPAYEECAAAFTKENPDITVKITQQGWGDYWTGISTGFVSGTAPDVFTNHLAKYPEFAASGQLVDIQPWVERDSTPTDIYVGQLADLWGRDGARYGLPKDWDTVAIVYNKEMLDAAGVTIDDLNNATWNPEPLLKSLPSSALMQTATMVLARTLIQRMSCSTASLTPTVPTPTVKPSGAG
jgi:multiple sugar transport system substrate-binding protein